MKITTFDPIIISNKGDDVVELFGSLGFEKTHAPVTETESGEVKTYRMKYMDGGYHVDVACANTDLPRDMTYIRMNVDNFAETYDILVKHGFKNTRGDGTIDTKSATAATMVSPSGFAIALVQHIKK